MFFFKPYIPQYFQFEPTILQLFKFLSAIYGKCGSTFRAFKFKLVGDFFTVVDIADFFIQRDHGVKADIGKNCKVAIVFLGEFFSGAIEKDVAYARKFHHRALGDEIIAHPGNHFGKLQGAAKDGYFIGCNFVAHEGHFFTGGFCRILFIRFEEVDFFLGKKLGLHTNRLHQAWFKVEVIKLGAHLGFHQQREFFLFIYAYGFVVPI